MRNEGASTLVGPERARPEAASAAAGAGKRLGPFGSSRARRPFLELFPPTSIDSRPDAPEPAPGPPTRSGQGTEPALPAPTTQMPGVASLSIATDVPTVPPLFEPQEAAPPRFEPRDAQPRSSEPWEAALLSSEPQVAVLHPAEPPVAVRPRAPVQQAAFHRAVYHSASYDRAARATVFVDEAQRLSVDLLQRVCAIADIERDKRVIQIVLVGRPALLTTLKQPELQSLDERITERCELEPLRRDELADYVVHCAAATGDRARVAFDDQALDSLRRASRGVPRIVDQIC